MSWHIGPPREITVVSDNLLYGWYHFLRAEVSETESRWRIDSYMIYVKSPIEIADTFIGEWLEGLWRAPKT